MTAPRARRLGGGLLLIAALLGAWLGADRSRRALIKTFFVDGAVAGSAPAWPIATAPGIAPIERVRVVLLDGLSAAHADTLPRLAEICSKGQVLDVDVGFPTVSLPVQHVLWTGLTQQQSGLQYHIGKLASPPPHAIPAAIDSVAVAESHPEIVHSFGFTAARPPLPDPAATPENPDPAVLAWPGIFPSAATAAIAGSSRLAFVHVLRIDDAGHKTGGASPEYAAAATWSDELLATLWSAAPADARTRWFILADHGHRPAGGHGDAEPEIRHVRACVVGGVDPGTERGVHLIDVARAIADSLGLALDPAARARPWSAALGAPAADATLPTTSLPRGLIAAVLALCGLLCLIPVHAQRRGDLLLAVALGLAWPALAACTLTVLHGAPTLSNPVVFPPQGRDMLVAAGPAMAVLGLLTALAAWRRWSAPRIAAVALLPWFAVTLAALVLARVPDLLIHGLPPLTPGFTAWTSVLLAQGRLACLVLAVLLGVVLIVRTLRSPR